MKRIIFLMLTLLLAVGIAKAADPVKYIERSWDDVNKKVVATEKTCDNYTLLTGNPSHWEGLGDGWYVVKDANVSYQTLNILGNAHLILCDGAKISLTGGVKLEGSHNAGLDDLKNPLFRDVKIDNSKGIIPMPERLNSNVSFIGVYDPLVIAKSGDKSKFYVGDDNTLRYPEMSFNINPFRAYLQLNDGLRTSANGDVNGDKEINVLDVTELVDYILGNASSEFIVANADVTEEGEVDVNDVTAVVDTILKGNNKVLKVVINLSDINSHTNLTQGDGGSGPAQ